MNTREEVEQTQALHSEAQQRLESVNKQLASITEDYKQLSEKSRAVCILCLLLVMLLPLKQVQLGPLCVTVQLALFCYADIFLPVVCI